MNDSSLLHSVLNTLEEGICLMGRDGQIQAVNSAALALLGRTGADLLGRDAVESLAAAAFKTELRQALASGLPCHDASGSLAGGDGGAVAVSYHLDTLRVDGTAAGTLLRFRRKTTPAPRDGTALNESESTLRTILDTLLDGVIAIGEGGDILLFNPAAEALFGYRSEEVLGLNVNVLMPMPDHAAHDRYLANYLRTGIKKIIGIGREVAGRRKDGRLFPLHLSIGEAVLDGKRLFVGVLHDLTLRKQNEEKLLTLSRVVDQSPNAVMIANLEGIIEYVNPSFTRLTGYSSTEAVGSSAAQLRAPHATPGPFQRLWQTLLAGGEWREEIQGLKKNGETYWALESLSPIRNSAGIVSHFLSIQQNITEQKRALEALRISEERFRQVADMSGEWLWEQDEQGRYIYSSNAVRKILGYAPEEIIGQPYLNLLTEEDKKHWESALPPTPEVHQSFFRLVNRYRHKDGHEVFTESTGGPIFGADGKPIKWRGVDHDITTRKQYEDALRLRDRAIEAASVGINIVDARAANKPNIYVNPALSRITGYSREELLGHNLRMLQGPDTDKSAIEKIRHALATGRGCELVLKNYRKEGTPFWNELLIAPVRDQAVRLTHFIGIHSDVTERRRAEEERHEMEIAKQIQMSLLPKAALRQEGFEVAGVCLPATHVGGDYFDYFYANDTLNVVIADVSGHSVGAALLMAGVRSTLKAETRSRPNQSAAEIMSALNELLHDDLNGADMFISMFYLRYHPKLRQLCYANAGHNLPLLWHKGEPACGELDSDGMVLGVAKNTTFTEICLPLQSGDKLLLYTDGITEAENSSGDFYGVSRLCEVFRRQSLESPETTIANILQSLRGFCGRESFQDDVSMVVLRVD